MNQNVLVSGRDTLLLAIPFVAVLLICVFRLDHLFASPKAAAGKRRARCGVDEAGEMILSDPDGRPSGANRS